MKKTLTMLTLGACTLLAFSSCQSTGGGYYDTEEAVPMSELTVEDGEIPPWLLEDSGDFQVDAGATTHSPDTFPLPEPEQALADSGSRASADQRQPELAANDVTIETEPDDVIVAPLDTPSTPVATPSQPAYLTTSTKPSTPVVTTPSAPQKPQKRTKRVTEPTLVTYKVKPGDNLSVIARRSGTTIDDIREASGISGDTIYAGTTIKVPYTPASYRMAQGGKAGSYTVRRGDTLAEIASAHGVSTQQLAKANKLTGSKASRIYVGQKLVIPGEGTSYTESTSTYTVKRGDTIAKIAARHGVTSRELLNANNISARNAANIRAGQKLTIPGKASTGNRSSQRRTYTVKRGDTIDLIASRNGVSTQELLKANKMTSRQANNIRAGQKLTIPGTGAAETSSSRNRSYTVRRGDSVAKIAAQNGVTVQELLAANKMTARQADKIHAGQKLVIPGKATKKNKTRRRSRR